MTLMPLSRPSDGGEFEAIGRVMLFHAGESIDDDPLLHGYHIRFFGQFINAYHFHSF